MENEYKDGVDAPDLAASRLAEIEHLSRRISDRLSEMIDDLTDGSDAPVKQIAAKLEQLHAAHLRVLTAEEAFHAKIGKYTDDADAIDYDAVRVDVGCRLDRILQNGTVRCEVTLGTSSWSYDPALLAADVGTAAFDVTVAQLSSRFGAGPGMTVTLT